jgi:hypothetical protein
MVFFSFDGVFFFSTMKPSCGKALCIRILEFVRHHKKAWRKPQNCRSILRNLQLFILHVLWFFTCKRLSSLPQVGKVVLAEH